MDVCRFFTSLFSSKSDKNVDGRGNPGSALVGDVGYSRVAIVSPGEGAMSAENQSGQGIPNPADLSVGVPVEPLAVEFDAGDEVIKQALTFVGVSEEGGDNKGKQVEEFQKAVDGKASGESWCMGFAMFVLLAVAKAFNLKMRLFKSESCTEVWNKSPKECRVLIDNLEPGDLLIWQYYGADGKPTWKGHTGFFKQWARDGRLETIEGNTGPAVGEIEREGDGVYIKIRTKTGTAKMNLLGGLRAFAEEQKVMLT